MRWGSLSLRPNSQFMTLRNLILVIVVALIGGAVGYFIGQGFAPVPEGTPKPLRSEMSETRSNDGFKFVNPLLECDASSPVLRPNVRRLESELKGLIAEYQRNGYITEMSIYYRDLNSGPWVGISVNDVYSPASLLKVPVMVAALKAVDRDRSLLNRSFVYDTSIPFDDYVPNIEGKALRLGETYSFVEILEHMIVYSDNNAKNMLFSIVGEEAFVQVWNDLGLSFNPYSSAEDFLSVKEYSSFFRILYNATYLSRQSSELALEIMSRAAYDMGIQQGIPDGVVLSNKFGERGFNDRDEKQLHDTGIVYAGSSPYLICIMTRGRSFNAQAKVIAEASRMVYEAHTAILQK